MRRARWPTLFGVAALAQACTSPLDAPLYDAPTSPLTLAVTAVPPGAGATDRVPTNASLRITFDDFPDPDSLAYPAIVLRSGGVPFDYAARVDLVGRAVVVTPRSPLVPQSSYELVVTRAVHALDGRAVGATNVTQISVGDSPAMLTASPPPTWKSDVAPVVSTCALGCHSRAVFAARNLDLTAIRPIRSMG
jgi:hypothetical protein